MEIDGHFVFQISMLRHLPTGYKRQQDTWKVEQAAFR